MKNIALQLLCFKNFPLHLRAAAKQVPSVLRYARRKLPSLRFVISSMTEPTPDQQPDLKSLVQQLNQSGRQNDIKQRRAKIDALIDEDFVTLKDLLHKLAQ